MKLSQLFHTLVCLYIYAIDVYNPMSLYIYLMTDSLECHEFEMVPPLIVMKLTGTRMLVALNKIHDL